MTGIRSLDLGDFLGRSEYDGRCDLAVDAGAGGGDYARILSLGEYDGAVELRGLFDYVL